MDKKGIANYVMCILQKTFDALDDAYENNLEGQKTNANSHLIFPTYSGKNRKHRVSEQELRFEFIYQFLKSQEGDEENTPKLYYSIETPTGEKYRFSGSSDSSEYPKVINNSEKGESAQFDVVLFNEKAQRVCLIEFKAKNPSDKSYEKDLLKLNTEREDKVCFFVQLLTSFNDETKNSINKKLFQLDDNMLEKEKRREDLCLNDTIYICHVLSGRSERGIRKEISNKSGMNFYIDKQGILDLPQYYEKLWPLR